MRILLVEDDASVAKVLQKVLTDEYYTVDVASDGQAGWQLVSASPYDLVVLDIMLPKLDGLEFCRRLRDLSYSMPVLIMTALDSSNKKIAGLNAGADDYITKPFEVEELLARVRALLRRVKTSVVLTLEWGKLRLEPNSRTVDYRGNRLNLTPKEYALLELFLRNSSQVFSRRAILDNLWSYSEAPGEETVTSHMKGLRRKLTGAGAPSDFIETVYGVGYRLKPIALPVAAEAETSQTAQPAADYEAIAQTADKIRQQKTKAALTTLWKSVKPQQVARLLCLKQMFQQLKAAALTPEIRQSGCQAAHGLTGVLGIFGMTAGSESARAIQNLLQGQAPIAPKDQARLKTLIDSLDETINQSIRPSAAPPQAPGMPLLVLVDPDLDLAAVLDHQLRAEGLTVEVLPHLVALRKLLTALSTDLDKDTHQSVAKRIAPDVVLFDFSSRNTHDLAALSALVSQVPSLMVLICSADGALESRVNVSQLGDYPFLYRPDVAGVVRGIALLRSWPQLAGHKILAVDDDPQILATLRTYLEPQGLQIITVNKPVEFWQALQESAPDLLLLDISMPKFSGIELCQVVRQAPFWNRLPIVFFTSHADVHVQQAAFRAGADDLIEKSLPCSELLSHLYSQIKRSYLQQAMMAISECTLSS